MTPPTIHKNISLGMLFSRRKCRRP